MCACECARQTDKPGLRTVFKSNKFLLFVQRLVQYRNFSSAHKSLYTCKHNSQTCIPTYTRHSTHAHKRTSHTCIHMGFEVHKGTCTLMCSLNKQAVGAFNAKQVLFNELSRIFFLIFRPPPSIFFSIFDKCLRQGDEE